MTVIPEAPSSTGGGDGGYIDAGEAFNHNKLSNLPHSAPDVTSGINYERILDARNESHNWITYYGAYDGWRHSLLDQINTETVKDLKVAWIHQASSTGVIAATSTYGFEACPIVVDGVMFVTGWDGWLWALDATTGQQLWRYKHAVPFDVALCCANVNRGCAVANGKVYMDWQFHRDERACGTFGVDPHIITTPGGTIVHDTSETGIPLPQRPKGGGVNIRNPLKPGGGNGGG